MSTPKIDVSKLNLQVLDITKNAFPDIFVNMSGVTFTKRVLEDMNYPSHVQYSTDVDNKVFGIKACRSEDKSAAPFSKPRGEQIYTVSCNSKSITEPIREMMKGIWKDSKRYKVTGFMLDKKTMIFVLLEGIEQEFRTSKEKNGEN